MQQEFPQARHVEKIDQTLNLGSLGFGCPSMTSKVLFWAEQQGQSKTKVLIFYFQSWKYFRLILKVKFTNNSKRGDDPCVNKNRPLWY